MSYCGKCKTDHISFNEAVQPAVLHELKDDTVVTRFKDDSMQHNDVWMTQLVHLSFVNKIPRKSDKQIRLQAHIHR